MGIDIESIKNQAFNLVDPKKGTPLEKSNTAFLSINPAQHTFTISAFLARAMGLLSGNRICLVEHPANKLILVLTKTNQYQKTSEVRINAGVYRVHSKELVARICEAFRIDVNYSKRVRLYANTSFAIPISVFKTTGYQLFDIPAMRKDFSTTEEKLDYVEFMNKQDYIIKDTNSER